VIENKKIKNARKTVFNDIAFKSKLEESFYKTLSQAGFEVNYELKKFNIVEGFFPTIPFYNRSKSKEFRLDMQKVRPITYTPDFTLVYKGTLFIIEAKGIENDVFPVKRKLFRKYLETLNTPCIYFEVHTKKELLQVIDIIKAHGTSSKNDEGAV
jgi:hypothetical protein